MQPQLTVCTAEYLLRQGEACLKILVHYHEQRFELKWITQLSELKTEMETYATAWANKMIAAKSGRNFYQPLT